MRFILIITTLHRTSELQRFLRSAKGQTYQNFEIIIVDQNDDDRVARLLDEFSGLTIRHVRSARLGASSGRNIGLNCRWDADIVAFPDDDCWYPPDLLARVANFFRTHPEWQGLTGRSVTGEGLPSNGRWHYVSGRVTLANAWNRATCFSMFFRSPAAKVISFDETLGCGANTPWGGGEDLDFLLQAIRRGSRVFFDPTLTVCHPEWSTSGETFSIREKAYSYARGMGRVLRKHRYSVHLVAYQVIRPMGGALLSFAKGNAWGARYHWTVLKGRVQGWVAPISPEEQAPPIDAAIARTSASSSMSTAPSPPRAAEAAEMPTSRAGGIL
jgi:glycosyltransferase involved in cell wall biosynthesis